MLSHILLYIVGISLKMHKASPKMIRSYIIHIFIHGSWNHFIRVFMVTTSNDAMKKRYLEGGFYGALQIILRPLFYILKSLSILNTTRNTPISQLLTFPVNLSKYIPITHRHCEKKKKKNDLFGGITDQSCQIKKIIHTL